MNTKARTFPHKGTLGSFRGLFSSSNLYRTETEFNSMQLAAMAMAALQAPSLSLSLSLSLYVCRKPVKQAILCDGRTDPLDSHAAINIKNRDRVGNSMDARTYS